MSFSDAIKRGGGFWNNVQATITSIRFTTTPPGAPQDMSKWVYMVLGVRVDGASVDTTQHLFLGGVDRYIISENGKTLTARVESLITLGLGAPAAIFLSSLIEAGYPETNLPDLGVGEPLNLDMLIGERVELRQVENKTATEKLGSRKDPKTDREYPRTVTIVGAYLGPATGPTKATATNVRSKANGKMTAATIAEPAKQALTALLEANNGSLNKSQLRVRLFKALAGNPLRDEVIEYLMQDSNLTSIENIAYDTKTLELVG